MNISWPYKKIGELLIVERGGSPRPIKDFITDSDNGINWIKISDATSSGKYIYSTKQKIKKEGLHKTRLVKEGDFILSNSMSFGRPYIMKTTGCIHDGWLVLREKKNSSLNKDFLYYLLGSPYIFDQFDKLAAGSTVRNLNIRLVSSVVIPIPTLEEQKEIVEILDQVFESIDKAKANIERNIENAKELFQSKLNQIFSQTGEGWEETQLGKIYDVRDGTHDSPKYQLEGYPLITSKNLKNSNINYDKVKFISKLDFDNINKRSKVDIGDVLFAMIGTIGNPVVIKKQPDFAIKNVALFKVPSGQNSLFLKYFLDHSTEKMIKESKGSTQRFVGLGYLRKYVINVPSLTKQKEIVETLDILDNHIQSLMSSYEEELKNLEELKKSILQKAFEGELTNKPVAV